jgi:type IX secretion system PorP/SprF family membrane protein
VNANARLYSSLVFLLFLSLCFTQKAYSQDPFFTHFYNNRSHFNPALTGISGSFSLNVKHKSQWKGASVPAFRSTSITLEETVLCHFLDYGFFFNHDQEGAGIFETFEPGFRFAGTLPFWDGALNIRLGGSMMWGWKRIDFTKLIFSDQLDPRYGFQNLPSTFIPPGDGVSQSYISPAVGASFRSVVEASRQLVFDIQGGMALHNGFSIGREQFGHTESILGLDARIPVRWNAFFDTNIFFIGNRYRSFFSINPQVIYQNQAQLDYLEAGLRLGFNRTFSLGFFYHHSKTSIEGADDANWLSVNAQLGSILAQDRRIDLGFSYSSNVEGLRNIVGPIYEFSLTYHFKSSPACSLFGGGDPARSVICPPLAKTKKNKIYDNIWYQ